MMRPSTHLLRILAISLSMVTPSVNSDPADAAYVASPAHYQLLLENDKVVVMKMTLKPTESDNIHTHHNETVYFEMGGQLRITPSTGPSFDVNVSSGQVMWHETWTHQVTNIGETDVVAIIVEEQRPNESHQGANK